MNKYRERGTVMEQTRRNELFNFSSILLVTIKCIHEGLCYFGNNNLILKIITQIKYSTLVFDQTRDRDSPYTPTNMCDFQASIFSKFFFSYHL